MGSGLLASLVRVGVILAVVWVALVVLAAVFQRSLIYLPDASSPTPPDDVEEVALEASDGTELTAWKLGVDDPVTTILYLPGNAGNRAGRLPVARALAERGHAVLLLDYRGYGGNPGRPSQDGLVADAVAGFDHLAARPDVDAGSVVVLGESVGSGVAAGVAAEREPVAVVLRSPFPELGDVAASAYPILPVRTLLRDRYPTLEWLAGHEAPLLVVAGTEDRIVPTRLSIQVAETLGASLLLIDGAGHNDVAMFTGTRYLDAVDEHLRSAVAGG